MKKTYNPNKENMNSLPSKGFRNLVSEFYSRVGERFKVEWVEIDGIASPKIDEDNLPSNVSMNDVETVLNNMKNDGWF